MKHVIFLVHGMGDTVPGWSAPVQNLIRQKYQLYRVASRQKFDSHFVFKEINYNHVFEAHIEKWKDNAYLFHNIRRGLATTESSKETFNWLYH